MEYYSAIKKNKIMNALCSNMELETLILSEVSQKETDTICITYMWNIKYGTGEPIYRTETDSQTWKADLWLLREWDGLGI